jgi:hypothetical protein
MECNTGIISARSKKNTVNDSKIETDRATLIITNAKLVSKKTKLNKDCFLIFF